MRDTFLLKLLAVEAGILLTVGVLAVMERDFFAWLFSYGATRRNDGTGITLQSQKARWRLARAS